MKNTDRRRPTYRKEMVGDKIPLTMEDINKEMVKDSFFIAFSK